MSMSLKEANDAEPNKLYVVDEDAVFLRLDMDLENQFEIPKLLEERFQQGRYYLVIDLSKAPRLVTQPDVDGPSMVSSSWFLGVVFLNASGLMKMGLKVFHLGMHLLGQKDFPSVFVKAVDEVEPALEELRAKNAEKP